MLHDGNIIVTQQPVVLVGGQSRLQEHRSFDLELLVHTAVLLRPLDFEVRERPVTAACSLTCGWCSRRLRAIEG
jgi:hypothetical protein